LAYLAQLATGPTSPPGSVKPTRLGSRSVNRPSLAPSRSPSPLEFTGNPGLLPPSPGLSGQPRRSPPSPPWAKHSPLRPLSTPPNGTFGHLLSEEIWGDFPFGICRRRAPLLLCLTELELAKLAPVLVLRVCSPVEVPRYGAPGATW
jgi:hypothetical protein